MTNQDPGQQQATAAAKSLSPTVTVPALIAALLSIIGAVYGSIQLAKTQSVTGDLAGAMPSPTVATVLGGLTPVATDGSQPMVGALTLRSLGKSNAKPAILEAVDADWSRKYAGQYANATACLSQITAANGVTNTGGVDPIADFYAGSQLITYNAGSATPTDPGPTLNTCLNNLGTTVSWPTGTILGYGFTPTSAWVGSSRTTGNSPSLGTRIVVPNGIATYAVKTGSLEGFNFVAFNGATPGGYCVYVSNVNFYKINRNFFQGCYADVYIDGSSFEGDLGEDVWYTGSAFQVYINSTTTTGVDVHIYDGHIAGGVNSGATPTISAMKFTGLGSAKIENLQISEATTGPLVDFDTVAPLYGGAQISTVVFEEAGAGVPSTRIGGSQAAPWSLLTFTNAIITGNTGTGAHGLVVNYANHPVFVGGEISNAAPQDVYFPPSAVVNNMQMLGVDLETDGSSPIYSGGSNTVGLSILGAAWTGGTPLLDFKTASGTTGSAEVLGGQVGSSPTPFLVPTSGFAFTGEAKGTFYSGASTGLSCSGAPSSSFASVGGIVTHC